MGSSGRGRGRPRGGRGRGRGRGRPPQLHIQLLDNELGAGEENQTNKGGGRKMDIDPNCYRDNAISEGGKLKEKGMVMHKRLKDHAKERLNVNCCIETLGLVMGDFCHKKRQWVAEMGMDSLFHLVDKGLPMNLCYWIATRVDVAKKLLISTNGKEFPLSSVQIHWVLGIPTGSKSVPRKVGKDADLRTEVASIWEKYKTVSSKGTVGITRNTIFEAVENSADNEIEFKRAFLMMALNDVLCPTTCHRLSVSLLPAVTVAADAIAYDWCSYVLDHLLHSLKNFAKRFYPDGYANGCGGCTMFLALLYLDRLNRSPVQWGVLPRIKAWTVEEVNKAKGEDKFQTGDFGKLGCIDVAYGEMHPYSARDKMPEMSKASNITVEQVVSVIRSMELAKERPVENDNLCVTGKGRKRRGATTCKTRREDNLSASASAGNVEYNTHTSAHPNEASVCTQTSNPLLNQYSFTPPNPATHQPDLENVQVPFQDNPPATNASNAPTLTQNSLDNVISNLVNDIGMEDQPSNNLVNRPCPDQTWVYMGCKQQ